MPLPLVFIAIAAVSGAKGVKNTGQAIKNMHEAKTMNKEADELQIKAVNRLNKEREFTNNSLERFGSLKLNILNQTIRRFYDDFVQIKNIDFDSSKLEGIDNINIDEKQLQQMDELINYAGSVIGGLGTGSITGALTAAGAYGGVQLLATASTGTAISALSGAAASNATLAFLGGGTLASGGLGVAGGTMVLGGLVTGPALLVMGKFLNSKSKKNLEIANINYEEQKQRSIEFNAAADELNCIRKMSYEFYNLIVILDSFLFPELYKLEEILDKEGLDYSKYSNESKQIVASTASTAISIVKILNTHLMEEDGKFNRNCNKLLVEAKETLLLN